MNVTDQTKNVRLPIEYALPWDTVISATEKLHTFQSASFVLASWFFHAL